MSAHPASPGVETPPEQPNAFSSLEEEFTEPGQRLAAEGITRTLVFFGSAKTQPPEQAQAALDALQARCGQLDPEDKAQAEALDRATHAVYMSRYYQGARELAARLATWSGQLGPGQEYTIATGGGPGIMEAANRGAAEAGARTAGFCIKIASEQKPNSWITPELRFHFESFIPRKYWLMTPASALIVFPGGIGTLDELFEVYTLIKTRKARHLIPIVLYGREYWSELINFSTMVRFGTLDAEDLQLIEYCDSVDDAYTFITRNLAPPQARTP